MSLTKYINGSIINERLHISADTKQVKHTVHTLFPKDEKELKSIIKQELEHQGPDADLNHIDVSEITDMSWLFNSSRIKNIKIDEWDVSNVKTMSHMFAYCHDFNADLSSWGTRVSNVTNMDSMFYECFEFESDLSNWNVSKVTNMEYMFNWCKRLDCDLSKWDVSNVKYYKGSFTSCAKMKDKMPKFKKMQLTERLHISANTKSVPHRERIRPEDRSELIFAIRRELEQQGPNADLNFIDTSNVTDMAWLFNELNPGNIKIDEWDVSNVKEMQQMFSGCKNFNGDLSKWDVSNVEKMKGMFGNCFKFNSDLSKWDVSNVYDMQAMFTGCSKFNSDLSKWDVSNVKYMDYMFEECSNLKSDLSTWNVSKIGSRHTNMFRGCWNMTNNLRPKFDQ